MRRRSLLSATAALVGVAGALAPRAGVAEDGAITLTEIDIDTQGPANARRAAFDRARDTQILPKIGATATTLDRHQIEALPQGANTPFDRLILQLQIGRAHV